LSKVTYILLKVIYYWVQNKCTYIQVGWGITWAEKSRDFSIRDATRKWAWFISRGSSVTSLCMKFHFVHLFTSYSRLSGAIFAFVLSITITHRHTCPWKRWPNWTNYDSNWLLTHRILQTWPPATIIYSQTSSSGSRERDSHRMRKSSRKPRRISKAWTFRTTERALKCWKSLYQVYCPRRQLCWGINITLPKKHLFSS